MPAIPLAGNAGGSPPCRRQHDLPGLAPGFFCNNGVLS